MGKYQIILADPPWPYADKGIRGGVKKHYGTKLSMGDFEMLRIGDLAAENCAMFLWVTGPFMLEGIRLLGKWGFTYKNISFVWVKKNTKSDSLFWGTGHYTRANAEYVLFGIKGKMKRESAGVHSIIMSPVGRHSSKPIELYDKIDALFGDVPRLELFARNEKEGWDQTGLEYDGKDVREYIRETISSRMGIGVLKRRT